ncbi:MAG: chemotaxis protein CheW, partial [Pseudobdellovibrionaceae bacterium]|nr:chemotaxis protein CheW [Pseudobdellovibrionaceae bacterium]
MINPWSDVIYELANYFVFMGEEDELDLRNRVSYRLTQLAKASVALMPMPPLVDDATADGSWGLFDESVAEAAAPAPARTVSPPLALAKPDVPLKSEAPQAPAPPEVPAENLFASHYLICMLGSQQYALPIHQVREILEHRHEQPLPSQRPGIVGLVTVRGLVCPVVDVSHILHTKDAGVAT